MSAVEPQPLCIVQASDQFVFADPVITVHSQPSTGSNPKEKK